jgi:hypothetical protein
MQKKKISSQHFPGLEDENLVIIFFISSRPFAHHPIPPSQSDEAKKFAKINLIKTDWQVRLTNSKSQIRLRKTPF